MPPATLTITFGTRQFLSVKALSEALENALEMLRSLETEFASGADIKWVVVKASMRSPLTLTFAPKHNGRPATQVGRRVVSACLQGMKKIENTASVPPHFNEDTLLAAQKLLAVAETEGAPVILSSNSRNRVKPTAQAVEHIKEIIERARVYLDYGTIEGMLEIVSVHGGKSFSLFETLTQYRIECSVSDELFLQAVSALGKRVAITGRIRYRNHKPTSIQVETIKTLRTSAELPQPPDMAPIDITGGLSSEEHVRRIRDAQ